ncbi:hypothetical protein BHM03_00017698 [Ensete ventricosum]|nr:hypothetical protein BHM03_00017698 [Ensete ventricosum]
MKEGGRSSVNRGEGLTIVDISVDVSLAEKEGIGIAGRECSAWDKRNIMDGEKSCRWTAKASMEAPDLEIKPRSRRTTRARSKGAPQEKESSGGLCKRIWMSWPRMDRDQEPRVGLVHDGLREQLWLRRQRGRGGRRWVVALSMISGGSGTSLVEEYVGNIEGSRADEGSGRHGDGNAKGIGRLRKGREINCRGRRHQCCHLDEKEAKADDHQRKPERRRGVWQWVRRRRRKLTTVGPTGEEEDDEEEAVIEAIVEQ